MHTRCGLVLLAAALSGACSDGTLTANAGGVEDGDAAADTAGDGAVDGGFPGPDDAPTTPDGTAADLPSQPDGSPTEDVGPADAPVSPPDTGVADVSLEAAPDLPPADEPDEGPVRPLDDAVAGDSFFAWALHPGESGRFNIALANTGTATWSQANGYSLRAVGGSDPFFAPVFELGDVVVAPGAAVTFELYVFAPAELGTYFSDWQMHHAGVGPFGPVISANVDVVPDPHLCPAPEPPPQDRMNGRIHNDQGDRKVLDSTPIVYAPEGAYCAEIGFTDGRRFCPPRPEGHPDTEVCNEQVVGRDPDTGRVGPHWTFNGQPCLWEPVDGRCRHHNDNQFLVITFGPGLARACGRNGCCKEIPIP